MAACVYCGKEIANSGGLARHQFGCVLNPNRVIYPKPSPNAGFKAGHKAWNAGLTKDVDSRLAINDLTKKKIRAKSQGRTHSDQTKQKISAARTDYLLKNPSQVPYLLNHSSRGASYPEIYWKAVLDSYNLDYEQEYQIRLYSIDFAFLRPKVALEIDGEQHYLDEKIVSSDLRRTKFLRDNGWKVIRVRWAKYKKLDDAAKKIYIEELIKKLDP